VVYIVLSIVLMIKRDIGSVDNDQLQQRTNLMQNVHHIRLCIVISEWKNGCVKDEHDAMIIIMITAASTS
jgi:hypothetical protein